MKFKNIFCIFVIVILNIDSIFLNVSNIYNPKYIKLLSILKEKNKKSQPLALVYHQPPEAYLSNIVQFNLTAASISAFLHSHDLVLMTLATGSSQVSLLLSTDDLANIYSLTLCFCLYLPTTPQTSPSSLTPPQAHSGREVTWQPVSTCLTARCLL